LNRNAASGNTKEEFPMDGIGSAIAHRRHGVVWFCWLLAVSLWTTALLTTFPVQVKDAVLPPQAGYHAAKILHVSTYAFLAAFAAWLLPTNKLRFLPLLFLSFHGFGTEYLQTFTESRHGSLTDVGLDHFGIALGFMLTWWKWRSRC
jgi:VanZ like family